MESMESFQSELQENMVLTTLYERFPIPLIGIQYHDMGMGQQPWNPPKQNKSYVIIQYWNSTTKHGNLTIKHEDVGIDQNLWKLKPYLM